MNSVTRSRLPHERPLLTLGAAILLCELVGIVGAVCTATGVESWYATLTRPESPNRAGCSAPSGRRCTR